MSWFRYAQGNWQTRDAELILYLEVPNKPPLVGVGLTERAVACLRSVDRETRNIAPDVSRVGAMMRIAAGREDIPCSAFVPADDAPKLHAYLCWVESNAYPLASRTPLDFKSGLLPAREAGSSRMIFIVKAMSEIAATARLRKFFRFYLVPQRVGDVDTFSLVSAFFDDSDEPFAIRTPLFEDELVRDYLQVLSSESFDIYFFDEHNRMLIGFRAENPDAARFRHFVSTVRFVPATLEFARQFDDQMIRWFRARSTAEDDTSLRINLLEMLTPDYLSEQDEDAPGDLNERDIEMALHRAFNIDRVYRNPERADDGREFVDVLVATDDTILLIQAKNSPVTDASLDRTIDRKIATAKNHLKEAAAQLKGSINHLQSDSSIEIVTNEHHWELSMSGRDVFGLVIVKELFDPERPDYSRRVLSVSEKTAVPCLLLDYMEFQELTYFRPSEESLVNTFKQLFVFACEHDVFLRSRFDMVTEGPTVHSIPGDAGGGRNPPP